VRITRTLTPALSRSTATFFIFVITAKRVILSGAKDLGIG
jgi:hypothetical protein